MADPPTGLADLEGVLTRHSGPATITLSAPWVRELLAYLRLVEVEAQMQRADEPVTEPPSDADDGSTRQPF